MKIPITLASAAALSCLVCASTAFAAPGTISLSVTPSGSISICDTVTVTVAITGYTDADEVDGYNFRILYDPARFAAISDSATLHDAAGPTQNWLRFPAQENVSGPFLENFTLFDTGVVHVSVVDLRLAPDPLNPRGTAAAAGFLYEVKFTALSAGMGIIAVAPAVGGVILQDVSLTPSSLPNLAGAGASFTITGVRLQIRRTGASQVTITWPKGFLEFTDTLGTGWTRIPGATNSLTVPAASARRFYRAVTP